MKTALIALILATVTFTMAAPLHAASLQTMAGLDQIKDGTWEKRSHRCDTAAQILASSVCHKI